MTTGGLSAGSRFGASKGVQEVLAGITYSPGKPGDTLAQVADAQWNQYLTDYVPVENEAVASLRDTSVVDDAKKRVEGTTGQLRRARQRTQRELSRYGLRQTAAERNATDAGLRMGVASNNADILNNARLNQFDRNRSLRNELINVGRGLASESIDGLAAAAEMEGRRDAANRQAKAAQEAQYTQAAATIASSAMMYYMAVAAS